MAYPTEIYNISIPFHYPLEICKFVYCPIIDTILFHLANALDLTLCKMMCAIFSVIDFFIDTQKSQCAHSMLNFKKKGGGRLYHRLYLYIHIELIATCAAVTIQSLTPGHSILIPPPLVSSNSKGVGGVGGSIRERVDVGWNGSYYIHSGSNTPPVDLFSLIFFLLCIYAYRLLLLFVCVCVN